MGDILVVRRDVLFKDDIFQGFLNFSEKDYIGEVLNNYEYRERNNDLENDDNYLQVIPYVWLVNPETKKAFLYKRDLTEGDGFKEHRHLNRYSGGVGGHIDRDTEEGADDPIIAAMSRELREEVIMSEYPNPNFIGYINDDSDIYNKVHFGIVAIAETTVDVEASEGMKHGDFYSIEEVEGIINNVENEVEGWTKYSWPFVKNYLAKL
jgi:predicted NUDIX family phosphoesterase